MSIILTIIPLAIFSLAMGFVISKEVEQLRQNEESIFLNKLLEIAKSDDASIEIRVQDTIELIMATSRIESLEFRYGSQNYRIKDCILYDDGED